MCKSRKDTVQKTISKYSDDELIALFGDDKAGKDDAFRVLYARYAPKVHAYCLRVLQNQEDAEDIFQETFVRFYNKAQPVLIGSVPGFLITIARNLCLNYKRDKKATVPYEDYHFFLNADNSIERSETMKLIKASLDLLDFELREVLVLRLYDGMQYQEISEICGISVANARKRVFRAKQKVKEILRPHFEELHK